MNILDYIILGVFAISLILGVLKGFLKQIFSIIGFFVVIFGTSFLAPYVQNWFAGSIESENTRLIIAMVASAIILIVVTALLSLLIRKILTRSKAVGIFNRIFGGFAAVFAAYLAISVVIELILHTGENFLPSLKNAVGGAFEESWIVNNLYRSNFFGRWIVNGIAQKIMDGLQPDKAAAVIAAAQYARV